MKKLIVVFVAALSFIACKQEPKDYVSLSGKIIEQNSDSLIIRSRDGFLKKIDVKEDGTFSDTLKVADGSYNIFDGKESGTIHLKNGYDLNISLDTKEWDETLTFTGNGSVPNTFLAKKALYQEEVLADTGIWDLEETEFVGKANGLTDGMKKLLDDSKVLDTAFVANQTKAIDDLNKGLVSSYKRTKEKKDYMASFLGKGMASPKFVDYENYKGGKTSLDDLKGKFVYVDVWATWCGPCKAEIPFLKEVEKAYHGKNIEFVSISVDQAKDHDKWLAMVKDKELGGIQLFADSDWKSKFVQDYKINGIPRFILIDTEGNIVSADAPRPSDQKLKDLFTELNI